MPFKITGDELQVGSGAVNFEAGTTISVTVRTTDAGTDGAALTFDKAFTVTLTNVNEAPTDVRVQETGPLLVVDRDQGVAVATLNSTDVDAGDSVTYSITGQSLSGAFQVNGNRLEVGAGYLDYDVDDTITVAVRATDAAGLTGDGTFSITVTREKNSYRLAILAVVTGATAVVAGFAVAFYCKATAAAGAGASGV